MANGPSLPEMPTTNDSGSEIRCAGAAGSMLIGETYSRKFGATSWTKKRQRPPTRWPGRNFGVESVNSIGVQWLHWPAFRTIFRPWISMTAALASRSRWTRTSTAVGRGVLSRPSSGPTTRARAVSSSNVRRDRLPPCSSGGSAGPSSTKTW